MITAQLHTEAASSNSSTPLTTGSAFMNSLTIERVAAVSVTISLRNSLRENRSLKQEECGGSAAR